MPSSRAATGPRYAPAIRLEELRAYLDSSGGATVYEIAERLHVSVRTAIRYLRALEAAGDKLWDDYDGSKKIWRLLPTARSATLRLTTSQMVSLYLSRRIFDFLAGTGFEDDLEQLFRQLEVLLRKKDFVEVRHLDRKLWAINEAPYHYEGRIEDVNDILTALIREDRLSVRHASVDRGRSKFEVNPYTLLVYKRGLYLSGFSHHHGALRTFGLDGIKEVDWLKGQKFSYPTDYHPSSLVEGAFGLIGGTETEVRLFFEQKVARFVQRRQWHPSQAISAVPGGIELTMRVRGTVELISWILSFGDQVEVLAPDSLRQQLSAELARAAARYQKRTT